MNEPAREMSRAAYDSGRLKLFVDRWPLVVLVLADGASKQEYMDVLDAMSRQVESLHMPFVTVTDMRRVHSMPPADTRKQIADWMQTHAKTTRAVGAVVIVDNPIMRGALTALYWLFTPPTPQAAVKDWREAHAWALEQLRKNHVPVPPAVANLVSQPY
jgi:hypothetical protein